MRIPVSTGSAKSHQAGSETSNKGFNNDGSALKPFASLGARHTVDEPSNAAVVTDSSRQATDLIVTPAAAAVCPGIVTHQSHSLFDDSLDQNAVAVRIKKSSLRYNIHFQSNYYGS